MHGWMAAGPLIFLPMMLPLTIMEADQGPLVEENGLPGAELFHLHDCFRECL